MARLDCGLGQTYNYIRDAEFAANPGDDIYVHEFPDTKSHNWGGPVRAYLSSDHLVKSVQFHGVADNQKTTIMLSGPSGGGDWLINDENATVVFENFTFIGPFKLHRGNLIFRNCRILQAYVYGTVWPTLIGDTSSGGPGTATFENCILVAAGPLISMGLATKSVALRNCTLIGNAKQYGGMSWGLIHTSNSPITVDNCIVASVVGNGFTACNVSGTGSITGDYNVGTDASVPGANTTIETDITEYKFMHESNAIYFLDYRTLPDSIVEGKGTDLSGVSTFLENDIDGRTRSSWDCGVAEGFTGWTDYPKTANVLNVDTVDGVAGTLTPSFKQISKVEEV